MIVRFIGDLLNFKSQHGAEQIWNQNVQCQEGAECAAQTHPPRQNRSKTCQISWMFALSQLIDPSQALDELYGDAILDRRRTFSALLVSLVLCSSSFSLSLSFSLLIKLLNICHVLTLWGFSEPSIITLFFTPGTPFWAPKTAPGPHCGDLWFPCQENKRLYPNLCAIWDIIGTSFRPQGRQKSSEN